ncbi:uncharacterized protein LOC108712544 isoform X2 [Xenopus laevis]|uniref:Uncharacterized protein LOC108712544 isoform X2 n=1 Tax=Xenopus laevis TaxID=8355 RepID=A0A8J0UU84_XENLA|nr:uncharacterized protein LOC108712544 isoform X2 [Xenopus laevis]
MMPVLNHLGCSMPAFPSAHDGDVTLVIGTLDGDPVKFKLMKEYVSKALYSLANGFPPASFSLIHFSCKITRWCDRSVTCNPETVAQAISWVHSLENESNDLLTEALTAAFEDTACQTVYLVIDSLPGRVLQEIYSLTATHRSACSVNVIYLLEEPYSTQVQGSFRMISLHPSRPSVQVTNHQSLLRPPCCNPPCASSLPPSAHSEVRIPPISCSFTPKELPGTFLAEEDNLSPCPEALSLLRGARVLARRDTDGYYYLGHIAHEVEGSAGHFLIEFEKCRLLKGKAQFRMQTTPVCDIVHYEDARWKPLAPGDHVLAPLESNMEQYGPGMVLQGTESRNLHGLAYESSGVLVTFWNGKTKRIPPGLAVWISQHLSDRIMLELHMPLDIRKKFAESVPGYPFLSLPSHKALSPETHSPCCTSGSHSCMYCGTNQGLCKRCCELDEHWAAIRKSLSEISKVTKEKTNPKRGKEKQDVQLNITNPKERRSVSRKDTREIQQKHKAECCRPVLKENGTHVKDTLPKSAPVQSKGSAEDSTYITSTYKPLSRRPGNMTLLQETLYSINKAMKEDRLALEAAIRERRPRTAPLVQSHELYSQKTQELQKRKEGAKVDLWRMQAEQRKREEKIQEMEQKEMMMQENRRFRSEQRIQLDVERKQDEVGLEAQRAESRRAAVGERSRRQEAAQETERRKEDQRVQFWTKTRHEREELGQERTRKSIGQEENRQQLQSRREAHERKTGSHIQEQHRQQQLQEGSRRKVSKRLEQFYRKVEQESQRDLEMLKHLKEHNLQTLRSAMVQ